MTNIFFPKEKKTPSLPKPTIKNQGIDFFSNTLSIGIKNDLKSEAFNLIPIKNLNHQQRMKKIYLLIVAALFSLGVQAQQVNMDQFKSMKARSIGPGAMSGRITAIDAVDDNPSIMYAGSASGGLWKSTSGGITWEPIFDNEKVHSIGAISVYQKNPNIIWLGTGEGNPRNSLNLGYGVYRSLDAGKTWQLMGLEKTRDTELLFILTIPTLFLWEQ